MKNILEVWEDFDLIEKAGIIVLLIFVLGFVVACIIWPVLLLFIFIFAAIMGVFVFGIIGISAIIARI